MAKQKVIKAGFYEFGNFYHKGQGIDQDILEELARRTGYKFESEVMTRARIWHDIETGNLDISFSGIQTETRDKFSWFVHYISVKNYTLINKEKAENILNAKDFIEKTSLKFGIVRSFKHGDKQDQWIATLKKLNRVEENPSVDILFLKLKMGNIDAVFSQSQVYSKYLKLFSMEDKVIIQDWTPGEKGIPAGLVLSKKKFSRQDALKFYKIIQQMKRDGTLKKIYLKYLSEEDTKKALNF
mgnify:CR=1 FL=1